MLMCLMHVVCGCPNGFTRYKASCYKLIRARHTWPDAYQICSNIGGEMIVIESSDENKWVRDFASSEGKQILRQHFKNFQISVMYNLDRIVVIVNSLFICLEFVLRRKWYDRVLLFYMI